MKEEKEDTKKIWTYKRDCSLVSYLYEKDFSECINLSKPDFKTKTSHMKMNLDNVPKSAWKRIKGFLVHKPMNDTQKLEETAMLLATIEVTMSVDQLDGLIDDFQRKVDEGEQGIKEFLNLLKMMRQKKLK